MASQKWDRNGSFDRSATHNGRESDSNFGRDSSESLRSGRTSAEGSRGGRDSLDGRLIRKGYVDTPGGQMHYRRCGDGHALLLLHHTPASSAMWTAVLPRFANAGYHAIALDLPNCGESFSTPEEPKIEDIVGSIMAAIQALGFPPSFDLVGHQSGASIAMKIAVDYPRRVRKLVLWGIPILSLLQRGDILRESAPDYEDDFLTVLTDFLQSRFPGEDHPWQLKVRGVIDMMQTYERRPWTTRAMALVNHEALLRGVVQPTLCMAGEDEPLRMATTKAALLLTGGTYVELRGASCDVCDEFPDQYVRCVAEFLDSPTNVPSAADRAASYTLAGERDGNSMTEDVAAASTMAMRGSESSAASGALPAQMRGHNGGIPGSPQRHLPYPSRSSDGKSKKLSTFSKFLQGKK